MIDYSQELNDWAKEACRNSSPALGGAAIAESVYGPGRRLHQRHPGVPFG